MHSKRKVICGIILTLGAATGTIINAGVAAAVPVEHDKELSHEGDVACFKDSGQSTGNQGEGIGNTGPGNPGNGGCMGNAGRIVPVVQVPVGDPVIEGGDVPVVQVPVGDPVIEGDDVPVVQVPVGDPVIEGGNVPVTQAPVGNRETVGGDTVETPEEDSTVEGSVDIGDALTIVREQPVTPVVVVELPEVAAPVAMTPEAPATAPVAAAPAAVVTQPAPKAPTSVVVAPVTSGRSVTSVTTSSATSEVLGVQYSRLAATGSDPLPLALLAVGLLLLGGAMVVTTSRQPS